MLPFDQDMCDIVLDALTMAKRLSSIIKLTPRDRNIQIEFQSPDGEWCRFSPPDPQKMIGTVLEMLNAGLRATHSGVKISQRTTAHEWAIFQTVMLMTDKDLGEFQREVLPHMLCSGDEPRRRTCAFCRALDNMAEPHKVCSLSKEAFFCDAVCQARDWRSEPREGCHKSLCRRVFVEGSKGSERVLP